MTVKLPSLAQITGAGEQPKRVTTLIGAAEALQSKTNVGIYGIRSEIADITTAMHTYLDKASFDAAYARGLAMTKEQAIAFALSENVMK